MFKCIKYEKITMLLIKTCRFQKKVVNNSPKFGFHNGEINFQERPPKACLGNKYIIWTMPFFVVES